MDSYYIVKMHEVYEGNKSIYFILEYIDGDPLFHKLSKGNYTLTDIQNIMYNILESIAYIHTKNIMHRNINPKNILLINSNEKYKYQIKLINFGLANKIKEKHPNKNLNIKCGTPGFIANELLNSNEKFPLSLEKCDVFSAGVLFYMMLNNGISPFPGNDQNEILFSNKKCNINFKIPIFEQIPYCAIDLLIKMLEVNPNNRINAYDTLKSDFFLKTDEIMKCKNIFHFIKRDNNSDDFIFNNSLSNFPSFESFSESDKIYFHNKSRSLNFSDNSNSILKGKNLKKSLFQDFQKNINEKDSLLEHNFSESELNVISKREMKQSVCLDNSFCENEDLDENKFFDETHLKDIETKRYLKTKSMKNINII